jgi:alpha-L-rhamnosidase
MIDLLVKENRNDLIALIMEQTTYPGWGYLIKELGVKTWPETWSGWGSQVILVTATPDSWFFEGLGGITPDPGKPGFKHFYLRPGIVESVDWVNCSYKSPYGLIQSNWRKQNQELTFNIIVPINTTATVYIPDGTITESGLPVDQAEGITLIRKEKNNAVFKIESGQYEFESVINLSN